MKKALKAAARGTVFPYAGQKWIVLEHDASGRTLCLSESIVEARAFDEDNRNNFAEASSNRYLNGAFLDNLIEAVNGPHAFLPHELDLTADDGLKDYGTTTVTIFLLTVDQYRRNRDIIPNADDWWWLSTAVSTVSNGYEHSARLVNTDGTLNWNSAYYGNCGLRPACYLDSELLISVPDEYITAEQAGGIAKELVEQYDGSYATEAQFRAELAFMLGKLRADVEDRLDRWIPDAVWSRAEPYARHKLDLYRERWPDVDHYGNEYLVALTTDTVHEIELSSATLAACEAIMAIAAS